MLRDIGCPCWVWSPPEILGEGLATHLQKEEHWKGLGSCLKVVEGNPSHGVLVFNP